METESLIKELLVIDQGYLDCKGSQRLMSPDSNPGPLPSIPLNWGKSPCLEGPWFSHLLNEGRGMTGLTEFFASLIF